MPQEVQLEVSDSNNRRSPISSVDDPACIFYMYDALPISIARQGCGKEVAIEWTTQYTGNNIIKQGPNSTVATTFRTRCTKKANKITKCTHDDGHTVQFRSICHPSMTVTRLTKISVRHFARKPVTWAKFRQVLPFVWPFRQCWVLNLRRRYAAETKICVL
jgi:hypothetical protein